MTLVGIRSAAYVNMEVRGSSVHTLFLGRNLLVLATGLTTVLLGEIFRRISEGRLFLKIMTERTKITILVLYNLMSVGL